MVDPPEPDVAAPALDTVLITGELKDRPSRPPDYEAENRALLVIAQHMADSPATTLQKLAEVTLEVCRAGSAGVSLISRETGDFYWPAIAGAWKELIGGGTPRFFGPCGIVIDRDEVQLFTRPQRFYPYLAAASAPLEEVLLAPFHVAGKAVGTVWAVSHDPARRFDGEDVRLLNSLGRLAAAAYPLRLALAEGELQLDSLRSVNEALTVSSVRQQEITEQALESERALRVSEKRLSSELAATKRLQETSTQLIRENSAESIYERILEAAVEIMQSDMGSMQVVDEGAGALRLLASQGFGPNFSKTFGWVYPETRTSCGAALREIKRVVVPDVEAWESIAGTPAIEDLREEGIRAVQSTPLVSRGGDILGVISTHWRNPHEPADRDLHLMDVLARQAADLIERSQALLDLQDLNADLKHFSYAASHDLQEPLRMVMSYTQMLSRRYKGRLDAQADQFIDFAVDGARRMEILLRDLRDYWSVNEKRVEKLVPVDCNLVLDAALGNLSQSIQESGAVVTRDPLPVVLAEEFPLTLLFQNLVGNGIKYRHAEEPARIHVSAQPSEGGWNFSVADNGIGIQAEHLQTIFAPFKRLHGREYAGTGIGLAICQKIVARYRGTIWVESSYGQGSTFHFTLSA